MRGQLKQKQRRTVTKSILRALRGGTPRERVLHRIHCVVLVEGGRSASEVARMYGDSPRAVAYWVERFRAKGLPGLEEDRRSGRPSKLSDVEIKKVEEFVAGAKQRAEAINASALAKFIQSKFGVCLTARQCWRILRKLNT